MSAMSAMSAMPPHYVLILLSSHPCSPPAPPSLPIPLSPLLLSSPLLRSIALSQAQRLKRDGRRANVSKQEKMMTGCVRAARVCLHPSPIPKPSMLLSSLSSIPPMQQAQKLRRDGRQANASMLEEMIAGLEANLGEASLGEGSLGEGSRGEAGKEGGWWAKGQGGGGGADGLVGGGEDEGGTVGQPAVAEGERAWDCHGGRGSPRGLPVRSR
ncbi:unnamed protein product [Closterium sp. NIES-54]